MGVVQTTVETNIARAAAVQHGVVTRGQLLHAGLTPDGIRARLRAGRLVPLHRGVYLLGSLVGALRPARHREMAAVLACGGGGGAFVSHRSALWLRELLPVRPLGPVHLVLEDGRCRRPGIVAHRVGALPVRDVSQVDGIPTTAVIRAILDVAAAATPRELERVIARAERLDCVDLDELHSRVALATGRPGVPMLRAVLDRPRAFTRSPAEDGLVELVRSADLPEPGWNVSVGGYELDAYWPDHGVAIEVDGYAHHRFRRSFEHDRDRDLTLATLGIEVRRVTWRQIVEKPRSLIRSLSAILTRAEIRREESGRRTT